MTLASDEERKLHRRMATARYRQKNREKIAAYGVEYRRARGREPFLAAEARYRKSHVEARSKRDRQYAKDYPELMRAKVMRRFAKKLAAVPAWLTDGQRNSIAAIYYTASRWGEVVDHIVPLQGVFVCGLHVPWNLRVISAEENARKSNKMPDDELSVWFGAKGYQP